MTKFAEALDQVDAYDPKTVVRVNGARALGHDGIIIVAQYIRKHFGAIKCEVPVICQGGSGELKLSNVGFIVMNSASAAERVLAHNALAVDGHEIEVRAYVVKTRKSYAEAQASKENDWQRPEERVDWCRKRPVGFRAQVRAARGARGGRGRKPR
jgi:hypothetical protein